MIYVNQYEGILGNLFHFKFHTVIGDFKWIFYITFLSTLTVKLFVISLASYEKKGTFIT